MSPQSEYALEAALIDQLKGMEYGFVRIDDEAAMLANFKRQLEIHNAGISHFPNLSLSASSTTSILAAYLNGQKFCAISSP